MPTVSPDEVLRVVTEAPEEVVNEQRVLDSERRIVRNLAPNPKSAVKWLQDRGYEAKIEEGEILVRRPGDPSWGKVEPTGFLAGKGAVGKIRELFRDLGTDALDEYAKIVGAAKGAAAGATGGAAIGAGAVPIFGAGIGAGLGGAAGAAAGTAGVEAARQAAGAAAGFEVDPLEAAGQALTEGALVGAGDVALAGAGRLLSPVGKKIGQFIGKGGGEIGQPGTGLIGRLQRPVRSRRAKAQRSETLAAEREAVDIVGRENVAIETAKQLDDIAKSKKQAAKVALNEAEEMANQELTQALKQAGRNAAVNIARGKKLVPQAPVTAESVSLSAAKGLTGIPSRIAAPDFGIRADALMREPQVAAILRKWFGPEFVPMFSDGLTRRGSLAMKERAKRLARLIDERGEKWAQKASAGYVQDMAAWMLGNPQFTLGKAAKKKLRDIVAGKVTPKGVDTVFTLTTQKIKGKYMPDYLVDAKVAYKAAKNAQDETTLALREAQTTPSYLEAVKEMKEAGRARKRALTAESKEAGTETVFAKRLREAPLETSGRILGGMAGLQAGGLPGMAAGTVIGPGVGAMLDSVVFHAMHATGKTLNLLLKDAPEIIKRVLPRLTEKGETSLRAGLAALAAQDPEVKAWLANLPELEEQEAR